MHHAKLSWGIFALIHNEDGQLFIKRRSDGLWDLPGGGMESEEFDPIQTLIREVWQEIRVNVTKVTRVGVPLPYYNEGTQVTDIALAYLCETNGCPKPTQEAETLAWVGKEEVFRMIRHRPPGYTLVGPTGRVGRMSRMILDGIVLGQPPDMEFPCGLERLPITDGYAIDHTGAELIHVDDLNVFLWERLDPFTSSGLIEPKTVTVS